jgi:hypothetical protein
MPKVKSNNKREKLLCYRCGEPATSREHFPPKSLFPRGGNLQLKTVPSCTVHNNDKSKDDLYLLTHICLHAAKGDNLPKQIFNRSILPALDRSPKFRTLMNEGAQWMENGSRRYPVDVSRLDGFFDNLVSAIYFDRYGSPLSSETHVIRHIYPSFQSDDPDLQRETTFAEKIVGQFASDFADQVSHFEAAKIDEMVYANTIMDPVGNLASITIIHVFYDVFKVISYLTAKIPPFAQ